MRHFETERPGGLEIDDELDLASLKAASARVVEGGEHEGLNYRHENQIRAIPKATTPAP